MGKFLKIALGAAAVGAGVAAHAGIDFRIELHHDRFALGNLFDVVDLLYQREEREGRDVHIVFHLCLARKAHLQFAVTCDTVDGRACAAESIPASASANKR